MNRAIAALHGPFGRACLYSQDRSMATHAHREAHLIFHLGGQLPRFSVAARHHVGSLRHAIAVNPFEPHDVSYDEDKEPCLLLLLYIDPAWFSGGAADARGTLRFGRARVELTPVIDTLLERTVARLLDGEEGDARLEAGLRALTDACRARSWQRMAEGSPPGAGRVRDHRVRRSVRLLRAGVGEIALDEVARAVGLSRPHFFKLFRENVGLTPNVYLNTVRTERAIERLIGTEQAVTSIAFDLGFASQASFTRFFSANVGIPPTDYRRVANAS